MAAAEQGMTKGERMELAKVMRQNERVAIANVDARKAELLAQFEEQLATEYTIDDARWAAVTAAAVQAVADADAVIDAAFADAGIPSDFAPALKIGWANRGRNADASRRSELRKVATTRLDANAAAAKLEIKTRTAELCVELAVSALSSDEARAFMARVPTPQGLMPPLDVQEVEQARLDEQTAEHARIRERLARFE